MKGLRRNTLVTIVVKELVTSLRDRQTAIYTFVLPICLYPIVFWVMLQGALVIQGQKEQTEVQLRVAEGRIGSTDQMDELIDELATREGSETSSRVEVVEVEQYPGVVSPDEVRSWVGRSAEKADPLPEEQVDAALLLGQTGEQGNEVAQLFYDSTRSRSEIARSRVSQRLPELSTRLRARAATEAGIDPMRLDPITIERKRVAPPRDAGALILASLLPLLLVIMGVMGAFFPAVDLTAGEKERKTAETTMLVPVPRGTVHQAKILAVSITAVTATFLNLLALGFSAEHLLGMLTQASSVEIELPILALLGVAPLALLFAFFTSAVLTGIAGLAATFKEGQALLGPVQMIFILPAMIGVMPGIELNMTWAYVPVVNVVLAFRAMLVGKELYVEYITTAAALMVYAGVAIRLTMHLLSREEVALSGASIPFRRILSTLRGAGEIR